MKRLVRTRWLAVALSAVCSTGLAENTAGQLSRLEMALDGAVRTEAERARDEFERKPLQTLEFFRFKEDMRVLELIPGVGWYTKILAPALRGDGKLYVAIGTDNIEQRLLPQPGFDEIEVLHLPEGMTLRNLDAFSFGVNDLDMVLTFRNLHNLTVESRAHLNRAVFDSLKSGGLYGVKDHTRRHMEADSRSNGRRLDPVQVIKEIQDVGFVLEDFSELHYSPVDDLSREVGDERVVGQTDRFTLLFRKP